MEAEAIAVSFPRPGVALVRIQSKPLGVLRFAVKRALLARLRELESDPAVRCLVLTGVDKAFSVGSDIRDFSLDVGWLLENEHVEAGLNAALEESPLPVVAALNGHCLGGGAVLALACDIRLAAASARIGFPEINVGAFASGSGTQRLPRLVGRGRALDLLLTGRTLTADEALQIGLVEYLLPDDELLPFTLDYAQRIASFSGPVLAATKRCVVTGSARWLGGRAGCRARGSPGNGPRSRRAGGPSGFSGEATTPFQPAMNTIELPVQPPGKIICVGMNYPTPGAPPPELPWPVLFLKAASTLIGPGEAIQIPRAGRAGLLRGRDRGGDWPARQTHPAGTGLGPRGRADHRQRRRRGGPGAAHLAMADRQAARHLPAVGPASLVPLNDIPDPASLDIELAINGRVALRGNSRDMLFDIPSLIAYISGLATLHPGDLLVTGSPKGIDQTPAPRAFIQPGDIVSITISGLGMLTNPVAQEEQ